MGVQHRHELPARVSETTADGRTRRAGYYLDWMVRGKRYELLQRGSFASIAMAWNVT